MALAADNNNSSETLFMSSGILSCVSVGTVAFTDLPKKWKKKWIKLFDFITSIYSSDLMYAIQWLDQQYYIWYIFTFLDC